MMKNIIFSIVFVGQSVLASEVCNNVDNDPLFEEIRAEIKSCHPHDVHLTFDDGPSLNATEKILEGLKKRNTKATFFISTTNLNDGGGIPNERVRALQILVNQEIEDGHVVGDHGFDHNAYDLRIVSGKVEEKGYTDLEASKQIEKSIELLNRATKGKFSQQNIKMFRFPYGRGAMPSPDELNYMEEHKQITFQSNIYSERLKEYRKLSHAVGSIEEKGFAHLGWNHDSEDFKYGVNNAEEMSVKNFVKENLKRLCSSKESSQVALFHDIKSINAKAIPLIIDIGRCAGLSFIPAQKILDQPDRFTASGVLIPKNFQMKAAAKNAGNALDIISLQLSSPKCELVTPPTHKSCTSSNGKTYRHCEGEDSICFNGQWESRASAILEGKCDLIK